jgi:hypothetical protein
MRGDAVVITGRANKFVSMLPRFLPRGLVVFMVGASKRGERTEGQAPRNGDGGP